MSSKIAVKARLLTLPWLAVKVSYTYPIIPSWCSCLRTVQRQGQSFWNPARSHRSVIDDFIPNRCSWHISFTVQLTAMVLLKWTQRNLTALVILVSVCLTVCQFLSNKCALLQQPYKKAVIIWMLRLLMKIPMVSSWYSSSLVFQANGY